MVTCVVVVTVDGRGQLRLVPGILEGRAEREPGLVGREMPVPVPVPVPVGP